MGNFVSKAPFDMTDFLSKTGKPKPSRRYGYQTPAAPRNTAAAPEAAPDSPAEKPSKP